MAIPIRSVPALPRAIRSARVKVGMRGAKLEGRRIGRTPLDLDREQVIPDRRSGLSLKQVAKRHGISKASVCRLMKEASPATNLINKAACVKGVR
jgi:DNA invertase Pin-like site-specific DNA recombinase